MGFNHKDDKGKSQEDKNKDGDDQGGKGF